MKKIKDIFDGKELSVWEDEEFVTLALNLTTIAIPKEYWEEVKKDLIEFVKVIE